MKAGRKKNIERTYPNRNCIYKQATFNPFFSSDDLQLKDSL